MGGVITIVSSIMTGAIISGSLSQTVDSWDFPTQHSYMRDSSYPNSKSDPAAANPVLESDDNDSDLECINDSPEVSDGTRGPELPEKALSGNNDPTPLLNAVPIETTSKSNPITIASKERHLAQLSGSSLGSDNAFLSKTTPSHHAFPTNTLWRRFALSKKSEDPSTSSQGPRQSSSGTKGIGERLGNMLERSTSRNAR